uniref:Glucagon / GIP / secretin / VIP family domain-containing protein n=1 Tax=Seriola dumerili TaxID=41447 RepID=A0A3B4U8V3_SERDU
VKRWLWIKPDQLGISAFLRWHSYQMEKGQNIIRNLKRHADGTFTSDFTHYLDKIKAKDFVEWLASTKREG